MGTLDLFDELPPRGQADLVVLSGVEAPDVTLAQHLAQGRHLTALTTGTKTRGGGTHSIVSEYDGHTHIHAQNDGRSDGHTHTQNITMGTQKHK